MMSASSSHCLSSPASVSLDFLLHPPVCPHWGFTTAHRSSQYPALRETPATVTATVNQARANSSMFYALCVFSDLFQYSTVRNIEGSVKLLKPSSNIINKTIGPAQNMHKKKLNRCLDAETNLTIYIHTKIYP